MLTYTPASHKSGWEWGHRNTYPKTCSRTEGRVHARSPGVDKPKAWNAVSQCGFCQRTCYRCKGEPLDARQEYVHVDNTMSQWNPDMKARQRTSGRRE